MTATHDYNPLMTMHGIFTLEELNQLSHVVKPQLSASHLNITSLSKHFDWLSHLLNSSPFQLDLFAVVKLGLPLKLP